MKGRGKYLFLLLLNLSLVQFSISQEKQLLKHQYLWSATIGDIELSKKWYLNNEVHVRYY